MALLSSARVVCEALSRGSPRIYNTFSKRVASQEVQAALPPTSTWT